MQTNPCQDAVEIWHAALNSVKAKPLVRNFVKVESDQLRLGSSSLKISDFERAIVVGAGKAGSAMAKGLVDQIGTCLPLVGWFRTVAGLGVHAGAGRQQRLHCACAVLFHRQDQGCVSCAPLEGLRLYSQP